MPYRELARNEHEEQLLAEMTDACRLLYEFRRHDPVIAGSALWSWAAGHKAKDVDIFVQNSFWTRRLARKLAIHRFHAVDNMPLLPGDGYRLSSGNVPVFKYALQLSTGTPVDLVLTPWRGTNVLDHFDYRHLQVGYSRQRNVTIGALYYQMGSLVETYYSTGRNEKIVLSKVQKDLWSNIEAKPRLKHVFKTLNEIYERLEA